MLPQGDVHIVLQSRDGRDPARGAQTHAAPRNRTMIMTGNLFRGAQIPMGEMGVNALVGGPNYLGSGIFAGRMR